MSHPLPHRRTDLVIQELDGEAILYDPLCDAVHRFDEKALFVWKSLDGTEHRDSVASRVSERFDADNEYALQVVEAALVEFEARDLLASPAHGAIVADDDVAPLTDNDSDTVAPNQSEGLTRREVVRGGLARALLAAPLVSTFFATPAFASGVSAHGPGGCKTVGFSCTVNADCCEGGTNTACQDEGGPTKTCCVQHNRTGCTTAADCCNLGDACNSGTCE